MTVAEHPYLRDQNDIDAVVAGIKDLQKILSSVPNLTWSSPAPDEPAEDYVANVSWLPNQYLPIPAEMLVVPGVTRLAQRKPLDGQHQDGQRRRSKGGRFRGGRSEHEGVRHG